MMFDFLDGMLFATMLHLSGGGIVFGYMILKLKRKEAEAEIKKYEIFDIANKKYRQPSKKREYGENKK